MAPTKNVPFLTWLNIALSILIAVFIIYGHLNKPNEVSAASTNQRIDKIEAQAKIDVCEVEKRAKADLAKVEDKTETMEKDVKVLGARVTDDEKTIAAMVEILKRVEENTKDTKNMLERHMGSPQ